MPGRKLLVDDYPYFCRVVHSVAARLPAHLRDECASEALVAMVDGADDWRPDGGRSFRSFVSERIRQRMIDEARRFTHVGRGPEHAGRSRDGPSLDARPLGSDAPTAGELLVASGPSSRDPVAIALALERLEELAALPLRWRLALTLDHGDAEDALEVSEARVTQLRRKARERLDGPVVIAVAPPISVAPPITEHQAAILYLIAEGLTNEEAAASLQLSIETIKSHVRKILLKLHARNRAHAVHIAWGEHWWRVG